ncbi:hypothetical protein CAPTEDRAFT_222012 [Capitella teleta]|uniref:Cathepsin O n=1 Tax=Capitella teleta TaxID=283909 RepID=R7VE68_CAPTE|nr:hypothetical protein CAPTEDRAFT_222012 [Capitella teleta]|eukprot:ELU16924.1 hypothetical protein CAPTEDRAFT_222012 [Capitella teleta]
MAHPVQQILFFLICVLISHCLRVSNEEIDDLFVKFTEKYHKTYLIGSLEYMHRRGIFRDNFKKHVALNSLRTNNASAWYGVTQFSDLTQEEFTNRFLSNFTTSPTVPALPTLLSSGQLIDSFPRKWDWRDKKVITSMKNQDSCGGCWAYAATAVLESMHALKVPGDLKSLSTQQMIDCSYGFAYALYGCKGGNPCAALHWMKQNNVGLISEKLYPTVNKDQKCYIKKSKPDEVHVAAYSCQNFVGSEESLLRYISSVGPVAVSVDARMWINYQGGIIQHHCGEVSSNHAVTIVGYDLTGDIPFYIAKNSWGVEFGHEGYLYLEYGHNMCSLAQAVAGAHVNN